jgi:hypothetical protein
MPDLSNFLKIIIKLFSLFFLRLGLGPKQRPAYLGDYFNNDIHFIQGKIKVRLDSVRLG